MAARLKVLRLGNRWDLAFHQSLKRDAKGEVIEFDLDPTMVEDFGRRGLGRDTRTHGCRASLRPCRDAGDRGLMSAWSLSGCLPTLPVLSHLEIARGVEIKSLGTIS